MAMTDRSRWRPAHWLMLAMVAAPLWKVGVWLRGHPGPEAVDPQSVAAGAVLFNHEWTARDPLTGGDGVGPVFNARSCVECHNQGGPGGGGAVASNVTVFGFDGETRGLPASGVVHRKAVRPEFQETLDQLRPGLPHSPTIPLAELTDRRRARPAGVIITQRNTPPLFGDGLIDAVPDDELIAHEREHTTAARVLGLSRAKDSKVRGRIARLADGRVGRFGWKLEFASLNDFVKAACANELGLSNPGRPQAKPLGRAYAAPGGGGDDLTDAQCFQMTDFLRALPAPVRDRPSDHAEAERVRRGEGVFNRVGCADCHAEDLGPVRGLYSDMLLHDMGVELESSTGYYGAIIPQPTVRNENFAVTEQPTPAEWRTAPLWGVADSGPYLHDGRAETLDEAVALHKGEAVDVVARYNESPVADRAALIAFLKTLRAPRPETYAAR